MSFGKKKTATSPGTGVNGFMEAALAAQPPAPVPLAVTPNKPKSNIYTTPALRARGTQQGSSINQLANVARKSLLGQ